ncbi:protein N-lysine methyltransferase METTL21A-like isoform X1 [Camellia sinensis]|uniref:protein N-lysine methyltransferase METTL21A-like isoform X1 n=1 Tax=Camellia sinensis TaxID=4442 RepID=UPI001035F55A|nr:protein N-lysine methyltransferase METTL21A-like isoform X1 [Camellia sinensis]
MEDIATTTTAKHHRHSRRSQGTSGVTRSMLWDSGVVLGKFLEHAIESGTMLLQGKKVVELGSGCGLVGCIAALLGAEVILTDLPNRLRLLRKNVGTNLCGNVRSSTAVSQLIWGEKPVVELIRPLPDYVLGSDVIYIEDAVMDLLATLLELYGTQTTIILAGELRNGTFVCYKVSLWRCAGLCWVWFWYVIILLALLYCCVPNVGIWEYE